MVPAVTSTRLTPSSVNSSGTFDAVARLIDAHIIDQHLLRENCGGVGNPRPPTADCYIQNNKERIDQKPMMRPSGDLPGCGSCISSHRHKNRMTPGSIRPAKTWKIVSELLAAGQCVGRTDAASTRVTGSIASAMNDRGFPTDISMTGRSPPQLGREQWRCCPPTSKRPGQTPWP